VPFGGLLTAGLIGAGGSIISSIFGSSAATKASQAQVAQEQKALDFQQGVYNDQKANQAPFVQAGHDSIGSLMAGFANGTYGPGSIPDFKAPTLAEAQATPGYQFTQTQGEQGIERGAAAAGGAFSGGTLKALAGFDTGLADSTYNDVFSRALSTYNSTLQTQQQGFNQLAGVAQIGEGAAANVNASGTSASTTIGNTLGNIGNAQAGGIVGSANSIIGGINGAAGSATLPFYLQSLTGAQGGGYAPPPTYAPTGYVPPTVGESGYVPPAPAGYGSNG
jgi:hypothetical protein